MNSSQLSARLTAWWNRNCAFCARLREHLADDWHQCWKWLQTQLGAVIVVLPQIYDNADWLQYWVSPSVFRLFMSILGIAVIVNSIRKKAA
jgi:hypothetical protein